MDKWDARMVGLVHYEVATWSKDPNEQVGALIVSPDRRQVSWGYNGFPRSVHDDSHYVILADDERRELTVHAELNALLNAAVDVTGWSMYCTKLPCFQCAQAIIQKSIGRLVAPKMRGNSRWIVSQTKGLDLMRKAGIEVITYDNTEEL